MPLQKLSSAEKPLQKLSSAEKPLQKLSSAEKLLRKYNSYQNQLQKSIVDMTLHDIVPLSAKDRSIFCENPLPTKPLFHMRSIWKSNNSKYSKRKQPCSLVDPRGVICNLWGPLKDSCKQIYSTRWNSKIDIKKTSDIPAKFVLRR